MGFPAHAAGAACQEVLVLLGCWAAPNGLHLPLGVKDLIAGG